MNTYADQEKFEAAAHLRDKIQRIILVTSKQYRLKPDMVLPQLRDSQAAEGLIHLRKIVRDHFSLPRTYSLSRIEGYDVSNTQGTLASVAMVTFVDGKPAPEEYRLFNIKTLNTPNDYHMMKEALTRRQNNFEWGIPDLLVIDGGKGQLRAALRVWSHQTPIISIVKRPDRIVVPMQTPTGKADYKIIKLPEHHPTLQLIQQIRDEAHRFSKKQHSGRRLKSMFK
jgi:excinuclease ABC subunit C